MVLQTWENFLKGLGLFIRDSYTPDTYYFHFKLIYFITGILNEPCSSGQFNRSASAPGSEPSFPPSQGPAGWTTSPTATLGTITRDKILQLQPEINHPRGSSWHVLIPPPPPPPAKPWEVSLFPLGCAWGLGMLFVFFDSIFIRREEFLERVLRVPHATQSASRYTWPTKGLTSLWESGPVWPSRYMYAAVTHVCSQLFNQKLENWSSAVLHGS